MKIYSLILLMVLCWSGNFVMGKVALRELPPFALLFLRVWFSAAILAAIYFSSGEHHRWRFEGADWKKFAELGCYGIALNQVGFTVGLNYTTVAHSALIIATGPIFVLLLARWQQLEALTARKVLGMALSFAGVVILSSEYGFGSQSPTLLGDVITLGGTVSFAVYTVAGKKVAQIYDTLPLNTFTYLFGALMVVPVAGWQLLRVPWANVSWRGWLGVAYMAVLASVVAYLIYYYALSKLSASRVAAFSYLQPVIATILGAVLLAEKVSPRLLGGGTAVLVGVYLAERGRG